MAANAVVNGEISMFLFVVMLRNKVLLWLNEVHYVLTLPGQACLSSSRMSITHLLEISFAKTEFIASDLAELEMSFCVTMFVRMQSPDVAHHKMKF